MTPARPEDELLTGPEARRPPPPSRGIAVSLGLLAVPIVTGAALLWAQQSGQVHLEGPFRLVPIGLVLLAIVAQVALVARAAFSWLLG